MVENYTPAPKPASASVKRKLQDDDVSPKTKIKRAKTNAGGMNGGMNDTCSSEIHEGSFASHGSEIFGPNPA